MIGHEFEEFAGRQGCEYEKINRNSGTRIVFQNGAQVREGDMGHYNFREPPKDKLGRFKIKLEFWTLRRDRYSKDYTRLRDTIQQQQSWLRGMGSPSGSPANIPPIQPDELDELERLAKQVAEVQVMVSSLERVVRRLTPKTWQEERQERISQSVAETDARLKQIQRQFDSASV